MSRLSWESITLPVAEVYGENPFPKLDDISYTYKIDFDPTAQEDIHFNEGEVKSVLPYSIQDKYNRHRKRKTVKTIVLENNILKAVFLPEYGCRLWSLYNKVEKRELLFSNPVIQPANLAIRNAWLAGGVEWNMGFRGHTPFTCSPVFCEKVTDSETGTPVLRFYEWERKRQCYYVVEAYLPEDSQFLMVRVRIKNCSNKDTHMYWWSNIAVPETMYTRTIIDAECTYINSYADGITHVPIRRRMTYSTSNWGSKDFFFDIPKENRKFIAALDSEGKGLIQASTDRLFGRKLFTWGMCDGARHWQDFLSEPLNPYLEIQAGIAKTQFECIPMKKNEEFEWLEVYGYLEGNPEKIHGDWGEAKKEVRDKLGMMITREALETELIRTRNSITEQPGELLQLGSGWAYLENKRRELMHEKQIDGINIYEASVGEKEQLWLDLLTKGEFNASESVMTSFMAQEEWIPILKKAVENSNDWFALYQLGILYYANEKYPLALEAFKEACKIKPNVYVYYCLAHMEEENSVDYLQQALEYMPEEAFLLYKLFKALKKAGREIEFIPIYRKLPVEVKENGRLKLAYMWSLSANKEFDECEKIMSVPFTIPDLCEGELSFTEFWREYRKAKIDYDGIVVDEAEIDNEYPLPYWMNFNMSERV